jgi:hydrogenase maturation protease
VKTLVAGFGNALLSDDGLGSAVARALARLDLGPGVRVLDFGTGGMHLALEMLNGYDLVVIVDAVALPDPPGTVFAIEIDPLRNTCGDRPADPHAMDVDNVLSLYMRLCEQSGLARCARIVVVGCVPLSIDEGLGLSEPARAALPACIELVRKLTHPPAVMGAEP